MTTISGIASSSPQSYLPAPASTAAASPNTVSPPADSVVISTSSGTLSASVHPADTTAEHRVASLVEDVSSYNAWADLYAHTDFDNIAKEYGAAVAEDAKQSFQKSQTLYGAEISREFGESGISVQPVTDKQAAQNGLRLAR